MIHSYNRKQILLAVLCVAGSLPAYAAAFLFFRYGPEYAASMFGIHLAVRTWTWIAAAVLVLISLSGFFRWRRRGGFYGYSEAGIYHSLELETGGAVAVDLYAHRVTGPAFVLSQLFLAGPLLALRAVSHLRSLVRLKPQLEERLTAVLNRLRQANKWQGMEDYPEDHDEILLLAKLGEIDFSAARGIPRFKAHSNDES